MRDLPAAIITVLRHFELVFREQVWDWANVLLVGAILSPRKRTVTAALRVMGLSNEAQFQNYHRVLNRDKWSSRALSRILLRLLVRAFVPPDAPVVLGLDAHIERRRSDHIAARGIYRDPVRSSKAFFVKTRGLRWVCMMVLAPIPWALRVWALPFLTVLAPSERYHQEHGQAHKTVTDWARQMIMQVRRWLPDRASAAPRPGSAGAAGGMVSENGGHLFRYPRLRAAAALAGQYFLAVARTGRRRNNSQGAL